MSQKITAILIEVATRQVRQVEIETGLESLCSALDGTNPEPVPIDRKNAIWIDREAAFATPEREQFTVRGYPATFVGNGLIFAHDGSGVSADTTLSAEHVATLIRWGTVHLKLDTVCIAEVA